jgi:hypothetical protein
MRSAARTRSVRPRVEVHLSLDVLAGTRGNSTAARSAHLSGKLIEDGERHDGASGENHAVK